MTFLQKLATLPPSIQYFFDQDISGEFISDLKNKHSNIEAKEIDRLVREFVINDFNFDALKKEAAGIVSDQNERSSFFADFLGIIFYPLAEFITGTDIKKSIQQVGGNVADYQKYEDRVELELLKEENRLLEKMAEDREKGTDINQEADDMSDLFSNTFVEMLKEDDSGLLLNLNSNLFFLLNNKKDFQNELEKTFFNNKEKLTTADFIQEGKKIEPTIGAWLRDFISKNGTSNFNNLVLSQYITGSDNAKKLNPEEKELLRRLLIVYRNLKFYPKSMEGAPMWKWEILPTQTQEDVKKNKESVVVKDPKLQELEDLAAGFAEGSIERKAIEEEMNRLNH